MYTCSACLSGLSGDLSEEYARIWDDAMMKTYHTVLVEVNQGAIDGVLGILQNLAACDWQVGHVNALSIHVVLVT